MYSRKRPVGKECPVETGRPWMVGARGSPECCWQQCLQGQERWGQQNLGTNVCPPLFSVYPQNPILWQVIKEEVLWLLAPERQNMREQAGVGLIGNACPQLEKLDACSFVTWKSSVWVQTSGSLILDACQEPGPSIFPLTLHGRDPGLHRPRWQPKPTPPVTGLAVKGREKKVP